MSESLNLKYFIYSLIVNLSFHPFIPFFRIVIVSLVQFEVLFYRQKMQKHMIRTKIKDFLHLQLCDLHSKQTLVLSSVGNWVPEDLRLFRWL